MKTAFILGAGVDHALGLPLAQGLLRELGAFAKQDGMELSQTLKDKLGGARRVNFSFEKYVANQGEDFPERMLTDPSIASTVEKALESITEEASSQGQAMVDLVARMKTIRDANQFDDDTAAAVAALAGESNEMADHSMLRFRGIVFNPSTRNAILNVFRHVQSIATLTDEERVTFDSFVAALTNIEDLLTELFSGFFSNKTTEIRKYLYVSWLLWCYMWYKSLLARANLKSTNSFYRHLEGLNEDDSVVTFNYTALPVLPPERYVAFHGDCFAYIRHDRGEIIRLEEGLRGEAQLRDLIGFVASLDMDVEAKRIMLPAIVPPSAMKPIIHSSFIDNWSKAALLLQDADLLLAVGYGFNRVDNHFNDLFRSHAEGKKVAIINPDIQAVKESVCSLLGREPSILSSISHSGVQVERSAQLLFVPLKAEDVNEEMLTWIKDGWTA